MLKDIKANLKQRFDISNWMQRKIIMYAREKVNIIYIYIYIYISSHFLLQ